MRFSSQACILIQRGLLQAACIERKPLKRPIVLEDLQVQHTVPDGYSDAVNWVTLCAENAVREILQREFGPFVC